jgi:hypothetical protein
MKARAFILIFLMSFTVVAAFAQSEAVTLRAFNSLIQWRNSGGNIGDLEFYLSESLRFVIIDEQNDAADIRISNGGLYYAVPSSVIEINKDNPGKMVTFPATGSDIIEIVFLVDDNVPIMLRFRRNAQQDCFVVFSVTVHTRPYYLQSQNELPSLYIRSTRIITTDEVYATPSPTGSQALLGTGRLDERNIILYIRGQNPNVSYIVENLISTYIREARIEGINHDIAIAQMLYTTDFLRNLERLRTHNYAGFAQTSGWSGSFRDMTEGVQAHIQHLKGYAGGPLTSRNVDPRYEVLVQRNLIGRAGTLDQLYGFWAVDSATYKRNIERILEGMYPYTSR